jgi:LysR family positive regulator for ilvC
MATRTVAVTDLVLVKARDAEPDGTYVVPARGLVREAAFHWFRSTGARPVIAAEPDGHEAILTLVALGNSTGIVPRLVLDSSITATRPTEVSLDPLPIGLCVRRTDLHRPLIAALWSFASEQAVEH